MNVQNHGQESVRLQNRFLTKKRNSKVALAAAVGAMGLQLLPLLGTGGASQAQAATFSWDPQNTPTTPSGGPGTWSLAASNWSNGAIDSAWTDTSATGTDIGIFDGAAGGLVTLTSNLSALGIVFQNTGYKINGSSTLTLGASGIDTSALTSGTTTIAAAIAMGANEFWNIGTGSNLLDSGVISGAGFGFTEIGGGTIKLTGSNTYTGTTALNDGTLDLNFSAAAAPASNILAATSSLSLGGGTLLLDNGAKTTSPTQTFAGLNLTAGASAITISNTGTGTPLIALGPITTTAATGAGAALVLTGPATIGAGGVLVPAVGKITAGTVNTGTITAGSILAFKTGANNPNVGGAAFATVGQYDYAAVDPTGTFIEGGSLIGGFYTAFSANNANLTGNADISGTITSKNAVLTPSSLRFNSTSATTLTLNNFVQTGGILVTPSIGANNVTINGNADNLTPQKSTTVATELITYQNNPLGFLNIASGIGDVTVGGGGSYTQVGAGTVVLGTAANLSTYTGQTYLDGGVTEIAANGDIGAVATAATLNLQGGTLMASTSFSLDNGGGGSLRPINVMTDGGTLAAAGTSTLTVTGAITGTGALAIGTGKIAGSGSGTANTTAVTGAAGTVILSGGAANTYSGGTAVTAGTLRLDGAVSSTGTGNVTIAGNAFLIGNGITTGNVTGKSNSHIDPGVGGIGTLTMAGLTLNNNAILDYDFTSTSSDLINITNTHGLILNATAGINVDQVGTTTAFNTPGTYDIFQVNGGSTANLANLKVLNPVAATTYTFGTSGNFVTLTIAGQAINASWNNTTGGNWSAGAADLNGTDTNWTGGTAPFQPGDVANFVTTPGITAPSTITLNISETVGTINFNNAASYTISSSGGSILTLDSGSTGPAAITDSGGSHTISAPITLNKALNATVVNSTDSLLVSGTIVGTTALTINSAPMNGAGTVILTDNNAGYSGQPTVSSGTLQIGNGGATGSFGTYAGTVTVNGTLSYDLSSTVTLSNKIIGTGTLQQSGTGTLNVHHANTMANTNITAGTLQLGVAGALGTSNINIASPGILDVNGLSPTISALSGNGTIDNVSAGGSATITIGTSLSTNNNTFNGSILNTTGTIGLVQAGTGTLILNGSSTYSGGTTITAGVIKAGANSALGTGTVTINNAVINGLQLANGVNLGNPILDNVGGNVFEDVPDAGASATISGNITTAKDFRVGTSQASSTLTLTGTDVVGASGTLSVLARGNIVFAGNNTFTNNGASNALVVGRFGASATLNTTIQDNAVVTSNSGIVLGGTNSSTDDASTVLTLTGNGTLNTGPGLVDLNDSSKAAATVNLALNGTSTLATSGFSFLSSSGSATAFTLNGGTILANAGDPVGGQFFPNLSSTIVNGVLNVTVQSGGGTINNNGHNITIAQSLLDGSGSTSDSLVFTGTGSTTLANTNPYMGNTTVGDGTHATTLVLANTSGTATGLGITSVNNHAVLTGTGSGGGTVSVNSGGHVAPGLAGIGTLSFGGMTLGTGSILDYEFGAGSNDLITLSNSDGLIINGGGINLFATGTTTAFSTPGTYDIFDVAGTSTANLANLSVLNPVSPSTYMFTTASDGGAGTFIQLTIAPGNTGPASLVWNNTGGAAPADGVTWDIGTNNNWNSGAVTTAYTEGSNVTFNDSNGGAASYAVTLNTVVHPGSVIVNNTSGDYTISGTGSIGGTASLTKSGTGTLTLSTPNTYSGGTTVTAGLLKILPTSSTTSALPAGAVTITGGTLQLATNVTLGSQASPIPASNINITSLSITGNGTLDINNNHIIINYGAGANPIASIKALITSGFNGGTWTGAGIMSTTAQSNSGSYGIGYADSADPGNPAGLASGQIEVMYTLLGDANLDGAVNGSDFAILATNFNKAVSGWDTGDFNYDGAANGSDFALLASNFNKGASQAAISSGDVSTLNSFASNNVLLTCVPEPASTGLLALGAISILGRRRRATKK